MQADQKLSLEFDFARSTYSRSSLGMKGLSMSMLYLSSNLNVPVFRSHLSEWIKFWARTEFDLLSFPHISSAHPFEVDQCFSSLYFSQVDLKSQS